MNLTNMKRLKNHLELEGERKFAYDVWLEDEDGGPRHQRQGLRDLYENKCGTTGCIAGMAAAIAVVEDDVSAAQTIPDIAADWLDLDWKQRDDLFHGQAMVEAGFYDDSDDALSDGTNLEAAKVIGMWIDQAEEVK